MRSSSSAGNQQRITGPAGSNMNDAGYPFRGSYKVDKRLSHGHSGATREHPPTSMLMRISGSNLVISQMTVPATSTLSCELGVGSERPKLIHVPAGRALEVPADRREYNLTTVIASAGPGGGSKHYNKLILQSDGGGGSPTRRRSSSSPGRQQQQPPPFVTISSNLGDLPPGVASQHQPRSGAYFVCGSDIVRPNPADGSFVIPTDVNPCHLVVTDPETLPMPVVPAPSPPLADGSSTAPQFITLECDPFDTPETNGATAAGPLIIDGEGREFRCFPDRRSVITIPTPKAGASVTLRVPKAGGGGNASAAPAPASFKLPEIMTDISPAPADPTTATASGAGGSLPATSTTTTMFTVAAAGCHITITVAGYAPAEGFGQAAIAISALLAHKAHIALADPSTRERVLSQSATIPRLAPSPTPANPFQNAGQNAASDPSAGGPPLTIRLGERVEGGAAGPNAKRQVVVSTIGGPSVELSADGRPAGLMAGLAGAPIGGVTFLPPSVVTDGVTPPQPPAPAAAASAVPSGLPEGFTAVPSTLTTAAPTPPTQAQQQVKQSVLLDPSTPHFIDVVNKQSGAACRLHFEGRGPPSLDEPQWVWDLAKELDNGGGGNGGSLATAANDGSGGGPRIGVGRNRPDDQLRAALGAINPQTPNGARVLSYLISRLSLAPPRLTFDLKKNGEGVANIRCEGHGLAFANGTDRPCHIQQGDQTNFAARSSAAAAQPLRLVAADPDTGSVRAEVVISGGGANNSDNSNAAPVVAHANNSGADVDFLNELDRALAPHCRYPDVDPRTGNLLHNEIAKIPATAGAIAPLVKPKLLQLAKEWGGGGAAAGGATAFLLRLISELNKCVGRPMSSEAMRGHMNSVAASMLAGGAAHIGGGGTLLGRSSGPNDTERLLLDTIGELFGPPTVAAPTPAAAAIAPTSEPIRLRIHRGGAAPVAISGLVADSVPLPLPSNAAASGSASSSFVDIEIPKTSRVVNLSCTSGDGPDAHLRRFLRRVADGYNRYPPQQQQQTQQRDGMGGGGGGGNDPQQREQLRREWEDIPTTADNASGGHNGHGPDDADAAAAKRILLRLLSDGGNSSSSSSLSAHGRQPVIAYRPSDDGKSIEHVAFGLDGVLGAAAGVAELWAEVDGLPSVFRVPQNGTVPPPEALAQQQQQQTSAAGPRFIKLALKEIATGKPLSEIVVNMPIGGPSASSSHLLGSRPNLETSIAGAAGGIANVRVSVVHPFKVTCRLAEEVFAAAAGNGNGNGPSALDLVYGGGNQQHIPFGTPAAAAAASSAIHNADPSAAIPSQSATKRLDCSRSHNLIVTIYDSSRGGAVVGEDRLTVPRLAAGAMGIDYRDGILSYAPLAPGAVMTASVNGGTERAVTHPAIPLDVDEAHSITLRQYNAADGASIGGGGINGARAAEAALHLPIFIAKADIERITSVYRNYGAAGSPASVPHALREVARTARNRATRDLLEALIDNCGGGGGGGGAAECKGCGCRCRCRVSPSSGSSSVPCNCGNGGGGGSASRRITSGGGGTTVTTFGGPGGNSGADDKMIFFRLRGEEERRRANVVSHTASHALPMPSDGFHPSNYGNNGGRSGAGGNVGRYV